MAHEHTTTSGEPDRGEAPDPLEGLAGLVDPEGGGGDDRQKLSARAKASYRDKREKLTARADDVRTRVEEARPRSSAIDSAMRAVEHDSATGGPVLAGSVAFRIFLVLIPYVFVLVMALGFSVSEETSARDLASSAGVGGLVAAAVDGAAELSLWQRLIAVVVGVVALLWATRTAMKVLRVTHSLIWGEAPTRRPTMKPVLACLAAITLLGLGALLIRRIEDVSLLLGVVAMIASIVLPAGIWLLASMYLPHSDAPWWALIPGAVVFGVGVEVLHFVTVYWIAREIESKSDMYGTLGAALALLLWSYLLGRIITFGAVVNAALWRRHQLMSGAGGPSVASAGAEVGSPGGPIP